VDARRDQRKPATQDTIRDEERPSSAEFKTAGQLQDGGAACTLHKTCYEPRLIPSNEPQAEARRIETGAKPALSSRPGYNLARSGPAPRPQPGEDTSSASPPFALRTLPS
jgi:hypothetical protein